MKRKLTLIVAFIILFSCLFPTNSFAHERPEHDKDLVAVLFSEEYEVKQQPENIQNYISALTCATYLTIDQYQGNGQDSLDFLIEQGYRGIPESIEVFDYHTSPSIHRSFTHRGWEHVYIDDKAKWNIRKKLLIEVVNQTFDFGSESNAISGYDPKCESFSALLYYVHILGDHNDDSSYKIQNGLKIALGGREDKVDIVHELLKHLDIIFHAQRFSPKYLLFIAKINSINRRIGRLVDSEGGINSDEKFEKYHALGEELMNTLKKNIPELLENEEFFSAVFYPESNVNDA